MKKNNREIDEIASFKEKCKDVRALGRIDAKLDQTLYKLLSKRYTKALELIDLKSIQKYRFYPSNRVIWTVEGKQGLYQVIPSSNFCSCDDFYFRVLNKKKEMCYHIIAQGLAAALHHYDEIIFSDKIYEKITLKLKKKRSLK